MHISWPFWTPKLRQVISDLKSEGKLREEPLFYIDKGIAKLSIIYMGLFFLPCLLLIHNFPSVFFLGLYFVCLIIMVVSGIKRSILPYSIGYPVNSYIVSPVEYGARGRAGRGWWFDYEIADNRAPREIQGRVYHADGIPKDTPEMRTLVEGSRIMVMVHPTAPKNNWPYFPSRAYDLRLTTDPVKLDGGAA